jgi:hypothetical protein
VGEPIFISEGSGFVATELARGPWSPDAQHGGAPGALLAREIERIESETVMRVARLTVEFVRPVPLGRLEVHAELLRPGSRVQLVGASLRAGDVEVARATALRIRRTAEPISPGTQREAPPAPPDSVAPNEPEARFSHTFIGAMDQRFVSGGYRMGPSTVWMRLRQPLVDDEEPSGLVRTVAAADFGNGVSATLDWDEHVFVNPDLTVYLDREPEGEWVCLEARTRIDPHGSGTAESALFDTEGRLGRSLQALYVDVR